MDNEVLKNVLKWLDEEVKTLETEIKTRQETIEKLRNLANELKKHNNVQYKDKYDEISQLYEQEKQRLIKLHNHYKKTEKECTNLRTELQGWKNWFAENKDVFDKIFPSTPPKTAEDEDRNYMTDAKSEKKNKQKKKR